MYYGLLPAYYTNDYSDWTYSDWYGNGGVHRDSTPTFMDEVRCSGTEVRLADCAFRGWGIEDCGHFEDVAIRCKGVDMAHVAFITISFGCATATISLLSFILAVLAFVRVLKVQRLLSPETPADAPKTLAMQAPDESMSGIETPTIKGRTQREDDYAPLL